MSKTPSDADLGFRALLTRAPYSAHLVASPSEYDAAPVYLAREFADHSDEIKRELAVATSERVADIASTSTLGRQALIAVQLAAPIGFGIVRIAALSSQLASMAVSFNPVVAILTVPALFFTAKKTIQDLRRALVVDPKVRQLIDRARMASDANDHRRAELLLKEALEFDIDPTYQRNGDLYLQLGLAQMADGRPRQALVSLAKASVLFGEGDVLALPTANGAAKVSKRGWTELLACAAIDSFAVDDPRGLEEWSSLVQDFAKSSQKRFESVANSREAGHLFGLFGVDAQGAEAGRDLAAKARFLVAKMKLRGAGSLQDAAAVDALIDEGLRDLDAAKNLTSEERFVAILQQAQFFARLPPSDTAGTKNAQRAVRLMARAAEAARPDKPALAARISAEAAAFALEIMPTLVAQGGDVASLRAQTDALLDRLSSGTDQETSSLALGAVAVGWASEQRFHLSSTREVRARHIGQAYTAYLQAGEPVSALFCALRLAYLASDSTQTRSAVTRIVEAGKGVVPGTTDPVSIAFAARYVADANVLLGGTADADIWKQVGQYFIAAADWVRSSRHVIAFTVHGKPLVHPAPLAEAVLRAQAAQQLARAGQGPRAVAMLEEVRASVAGAAPASVLAAFELEHATVLKSLGRFAEAQAIAESIEKDARHSSDMGLHRAALDLLYSLSRREDRLPLDAASNADPLVVPDLPARPREEGLLSGYAETKRQVIDAGTAVLELLRQPALRERFSPKKGDVDIASILEKRLARLSEDVFRLGIVGEFSSGKSTFINALLGDSVLPSSVRPTTSAPNRIRFGAVAGLTIRFVDGHSEDAELGALESYVTEKANPGNKRGVAFVEIAYPSPLLARGVELLDTPGISSLIEAHKATTYEQIPTCDAVILLATGRQPFSDSTSEFLEFLRTILADKVFYLINKIDQVEPARRQQSVDFARERVAEKVAGARVYALSAYRALAARKLAAGRAAPEDYADDPRLGEITTASAMLNDSMIVDFEAALGKFLVDGRGMVMLKRTAAELYDVVIQTERALEIERSASMADAGKRAAMHRQLSADLASKKAAAASDLRQSEAKFDAILSELETRARCEIPTLAASVVGAANASIEDLRSDEAKQAFKVRLEQVTRRTVQNWAEQATQVVTRQLGATVQDTQALLQRHRRELRTQFSGVLAATTGYSPLEERTIELDVEIDENSFGRFLVQGVVGFVGGFFLGIGGIFVAPLLGRFLSNLLFGSDEQLNVKLRESLEYRLKSVLNEVAEQVAESLRDRLQPTTGQLQSELQEMASGILAEFDRDLSSIVTERESGDQAAADLAQVLATMQARAAKARRVLKELGA